ncbi:MAG: hypothetical protein L0H84_19485 [Pseudonocardia sp.]|nr:hypothetical protein [Pseudonocardia sp.]
MRAWRLEVWWTVPRPLAPDRLEQLVTEADTVAGWVLARHPLGLSIAARVRTARPHDALGWFAGRADGWLRQRVGGTRILAMRACTEEIVAAELAHPDVPPLASAADVAQLLGVPRRRVQHLYSNDPLFPAPVARVATGPLWTVSAIRGYRRARPAEDADGS